MKRINFVSVALMAVLVVLVVGCTPLQQSTGGYEDAPANGRYYRSAPLGGQQVIVVERDPFTGQYYQVSPYGYYNGSPFYNDPRPFGYHPGVQSNGGYRRNENTRTYRPVPRNHQPERQQRPASPTTQKAKDAIRGKN